MLLYKEQVTGIFKKAFSFLFNSCGDLEGVLTKLFPAN